MIWRDAWRMAVTQEMDGGDSCAIVSTLLALDPSPDWARLVQYFFPVGSPTPVRHPDKSKWYGRPWRFTRDQMIPLLCAFIVCRHKAHGLWPDVFRYADELYKMHRKRRFLTAWNKYANARYDTPEEQAQKDPGTIWVKPKHPDFTGPEILALWIRLRRQDLPWWSRGLAHVILHILDLETLGGSIVWSFKPKTDRVTRNHMLVTIISRKVQPTLTSWLNFEIADFGDWINRWNDHCEAVGESNTAPHFDAVLKEMNR